MLMLKELKNIRKELQKQLVSVLKFDPSVMSKVVWVTYQGLNIVAALRHYRRLDCQDHIYNTVIRHALDITELSATVPEVGGTLLAVKKVVRFVKKTKRSAKPVIQDRSEDGRNTLQHCISHAQVYQGCVLNYIKSWRVVERPKEWLMCPQMFWIFWSVFSTQYPTLNLVVLQRVGSQAIEQPVEMRLRSQLERVTSDTPPPAAKKRALSDFELEWENVAQGDVTAVEDEVHLNLNPSKEYDDRDLLGWWSQHAKTIPLLSRLARHVLSIPASSSSSERVFSTAGRMLEERRTSLKPSTVDAVLLLQQHSPINSE